MSIQTYFKNGSNIDKKNSLQLIHHRNITESAYQSWYSWSTEQLFLFVP